MGAYLSKPDTEKKSDNFLDSEKYSCGVSGMQGWRLSMEDDYNCVPDIGDNTGFFSVYDGHGGGEVASYCALHFINILKETEQYKEGKLQEALKCTFMEIDRKLKDPNVIRELKFLSKMKPGDPPPTEDDIKKMEEQEKIEFENAADETRLLHEEATMDIEVLLAKYGRVANETREMMSSLSHEKDWSGSSQIFDGPAPGSGAESDVTVKALEQVTDEKDADESKVTSEKSIHNVVQEEVSEKCVEATDAVEPKILKKTFVKCKLTKMPDEEDDDDEDYDSFESDEQLDYSSEEDSESSDDSEEEIEDEEEDEVEECDENEEVSTDSLKDSMGVTTEEPGSDSGTTAVVALLRGLDLHVANAGDSRCVLCRKDGKAFDMSDDHKPEDEIELTRIRAAGGHVNMQGRVNGGLNLSRALGDHCYKTNKDFSLEDQMISAMPDVRSVRLEPDDEFLVLACDGIWNVFSSQEVIDFVRKRLNPSKENAAEGIESTEENKAPKLSQICEALFNECLAPDTMGDGTGCDNMTCIIIKFDKEWLKKNDNPSADAEMKKDIEITKESSNGNTSFQEDSSSYKETGDHIRSDDNSLEKSSDYANSSPLIKDNQENMELKEQKKRLLGDENCINGNGTKPKRLKSD